MDSDVVVTGLAELQKQLDMLAPNIEKKLLRGAMRAGTKVVLARAKQGIHSVSGDLVKSLRISTSARGGVVKATLKAGNKKAYYAHFVEFGTAAHAIAAKGGGAVSFGGVAYASVKHPGATKKAFMRPALDAMAANDSPALIAVADYLRPRLETELASLPDETS